MTATTTMRRTRSLWLASALVLFGTGLAGSGAAAAPTLGVAALLGEAELGPAITAVEPGSWRRARRWWCAVAASSRATSCAWIR
ncbi:MAG: hypothetical protein IPK80_00385 [Nannocystis sp.]|nr:hypothetical protein [Nannocystis sp.]